MKLTEERIQQVALIDVDRGPFELGQLIGTPTALTFLRYVG